MSTASSAMLARVHGQCGWAIITTVARPGVRAIALSTGHELGGVAVRPGVLAYLHSITMPPPTEIAHSVPARTPQNHRPRAENGYGCGIAPSAAYGVGSKGLSLFGERQARRRRRAVGIRCYRRTCSIPPWASRWHGIGPIRREYPS